MRTIHITRKDIALLEKEPLLKKWRKSKKKSCKKRKPRKAPKGKKKGAVKSKRKTAMVKGKKKGAVKSKKRTAVKTVDVPVLELVHNVSHKIVVTYPDGSKAEFPPPVESAGEGKGSEKPDGEGAGEAPKAGGAE